MKIVYIIRDMNEGGHLSLLEYYLKNFRNKYEIIIVTSLAFNYESSPYSFFNDKKINIIQSSKIEIFFIKYISLLLSFILIIPRKILYKMKLKTTDLDRSFFRNNIIKKIGFFLLYSKIKYVEKNFNPDLFHSIGFRLENYKLINFFRTKKLIYSEIEDPLNRILSIKYIDLRKKYIDIFEKFLDICFFIIVPSNLIKKNILETCNLDVNKIKIIPWLIDQNIITKVKDLNDIICFGSLGRLETSKGYHILIEAFSKISSNNWLLYISGEGTERHNLEKLVNKYNLGDKIIFLGWIKDKKSFFDKIDVFIHPSLTEGMPLVIIEAMYFKKPIIGTSVGSIPEMFDQSGILVKPNDINNLENGINYLVNNKNKILSMIQYNEFEFNSKYSKDILIKNLEEIYNS